MCVVQMSKLFIILLLIISNISLISSSLGDLSPYYQNCVKKCMVIKCENDEVSYSDSALKHIDIWSLLMWNCRDECRYNCMWRTVEVFKERDFNIPKFHGKWPFRRMFGVQEPGSAVASLLNLIAHARMSAQVARRFPVRTMPVVVLWHVFALVCMNAWVWSIVFHTRDTPFTEFMDYACALSMVMVHFIAIFARIFVRLRVLVALVTAACLVYYGLHVQYLYGGRIDYDYNMSVNLTFGVAGGLLWLLFGAPGLAAGAGAGWRYTRRAAWFAAAAAAAASLELLDFPPLLGVWDAHALWHLLTAPLPLLFYRFVIDDLGFWQSLATERGTLKAA